MLGQSTGIPESLCPLQFGRQNSKNLEITIRIPLQITTENTNGRGVLASGLGQEEQDGGKRERNPLRSEGLVAQKAVVYKETLSPDPYIPSSI